MNWVNHVTYSKEGYTVNTCVRWTITSLSHGPSSKLFATSDYHNSIFILKFNCILYIFTSYKLE